MVRYHPKNERIKRAFFTWLREAHRRSPATVNQYRKAIRRFEEVTGFSDFQKFRKEDAIDFKHYLCYKTRSRRGHTLSKATILCLCRSVKEFFKWLTLQPGYRRLSLSDVEYFNLPDKEMRMAQAGRLRTVPTIEQIRHVLATMPHKTDIEQRNRALVAFTLLTGMRDGAIASLKLRHLQLDQRLVEQLGSEVNTKFSKTIYTYFFPVGEDIVDIFTSWVKYLREKLLYSDDDPVFPQTNVVPDEDFTFTVTGLKPACWQSAGPIRKIFKEAFQQAGLPYCRPHSFRFTLVRLGECLCRTPEEFKAWSQNLGHEQVLTSFYSYGSLDVCSQGEVIASIGERSQDVSQDRLNNIDKKLDTLLNFYGWQSGGKRESR